MLALDFISISLQPVWYICTLLSVLPPALCSDLIISFFSVSYGLSSIPYLSLVAFSHYCLETHLYKIDLSQTESRGTIATQCSAGGRQAFAKLWAHTHKHTHSVLTLIHSHGITAIRAKKWGKQLYLFSADPATAKGSLLTSQWNIFSTNSVDRWGCLFVISWWSFFFLLFYLFISIITETKTYPEHKAREIDCVVDRKLES